MESKNMAQQSEMIKTLIAEIKPQDELYKQQTTTMMAVEWLFSQIPFEWSSGRDAYEALAIAKQMEKEQIIKAWIDAERYNDSISKPLAEEYYNETYGKG